MHLTHYGHACVLVEIESNENTTRILIDPGTYSNGFEDLTGIDLILVTHQHPDHIDMGRVTTLLERNPQAELVVDRETMIGAEGAGISCRAVNPDDSFVLNDVTVDVVGGVHACIHSALPSISNNGYILGGTIFHPGDALDTMATDIDILFLPIGGPWMKISESIDYMRSICPRVVVPIHQAGLAPVHQQLHHQLLTALAPPSCEIVALPEGRRQLM